MKGSLRLLSIAAAMTMLVALAAPATAATTWFVDDATGNDANNCTSAATPCKTIQAAINKALPNDTIIVAAGLYLEPAGGPLTVNKTLTLLGAQSGVDARFLRGPESIVTDPQGTSVNAIASNSVIDGFTLKNSTAGFPGFGLWLNAGVTGTHIINNIIEDNIVGIGLANTAASQALIQHNLIRNNNRPGAASGAGIYTDEFVSGIQAGLTASNVLIDENDFRGNIVEGIDISNTHANPFTDLEVSENDFDMNGRAIFLINTDTSSFHDNTVTNSTFVGSADVRIFGGVDDLTVLRNDFSQGPGHGIRLSGSLGANTAVEIHQNNFEVYTLTGLTVDPGSHVGTVNAECNWWNSPTGPTDPLGNPGGTGEEVVGDADYTPWLIARAPGGPCIGGLASTPGKVTGGGQVEGQDPLFSPIGELLTLPAIILSANGARANFGFIIQFADGASAPKGNLMYQDHDAGVRIKATSFDQLIIEAGLCGPNTHATFTGMADVNGVSETLTVVVDDCGEPSSGPPPDTFQIDTDTYSNGGPLIGGNIQIH